mmetsp:Transcript_51877/g.151010  ORF Transcript_51877/g.151010 Transcript_51877/m.151010 type:complete len:522 (-) Transcript_51877:10-1575(-)|eukprot:CAMPEP_0170244372 /NCGR_PEP_ID=MMETSP0116_2-20130129/21966_1 /TAXON_ID=400756 /ORGANISM="Durinskia baltica, Strain CSIRO CS-38" /LENGTH=521 /DNA_ID=CAMNT_0010495235 /DNA_START=54 /DNA_END=1619 /DNA_ORIENTATION=-
MTTSDDEEDGRAEPNGIPVIESHTSSASIDGSHEDGDGLVSDSARHGCHNIVFGPQAGRVGLENLGNTCFMNTGLQCLSHLEPFAAFFLSGKYEEEVNRSSEFGCKGELADAFADLQRSLWQGDHACYAPKNFHERLERFRPDFFEGHEQQDVHEFLAFCLDGLHEDLNRLSHRPRPQTQQEERRDEALGSQHGEEFMAALSWMRYLERGRSFIVDLLQGQLRSSLTCVTCGHRSRKFEAFSYLSLPVSWEMGSLSDCLEGYLAEELLTDDEQWFCEKCKKKVDARKKIDLWELPPVLVVHFKRFEYEVASGRFKKIGRLLDTPLTLDLSQYCSTQQLFGAKYDVTCVANHRGKFETGHYTATCYFSGRFFEFDDTDVKRLHRGSQIVGPHAYVLFLVRRSAGNGLFDGGHRTPLLRRQSVTLPELWPQRRSNLEMDLLSSFRRQPSDGGPMETVEESQQDEEYLMRFTTMIRFQSVSDLDGRPSLVIPKVSQGPFAFAPPRSSCCSAGLQGLMALLWRSR